jgi:hypothetical protein
MTQNDSSDRQKAGAGKPKKGGPSLVLVAVTIGVAGALAYYVASQRKESGKPDEEDAAPAAKGPQSKEEAELVKGLGRALAIGPAAEAVDAEGTERVAVDEIPGLDAALGGTDVDAVIALLEGARIAHVVVDPSITPRDPIPKNTVRNRLALSYPAGRLVAKALTRRLFVYEIGAPPLELDDASKAALIRIARAAAGGAGASEPAAVPAAITAKGDWRAILTPRRVQGRHVMIYTESCQTLAECARALGERFNRSYEKKNLARELGPLSEALASKLNLELEIEFGTGTFYGPRDGLFLWRVLEPGIYGLKMDVEGRQQMIPPWYSMTNDFRTVESLLARASKDLGGASADYWKRDDVPITRFRTLHFRERTPGGAIESLYRAMPRIPAPAEITKENLVKSLVGLGDWLADNQVYADGRHIYRYFPVKDEENDEYNVVRHTLGVYSMALVDEFSKDPKHLKTAEAGWKWIEERIRWGGAPRRSDGSIDDSLKSWYDNPLPGPDVAIFEADENEYDKKLRPDWSSKMGAVAVAILGYTQAKRVGWALGPEREKILDGLAKFVLYMQKPDGSFHHYYVAPQNKYYGTDNSIYPGEILYAVARLFGETRDERYRTAFKRGMDEALGWFKKEMAIKEPDGTYLEERRKELVQFQPWIAMAMEEMHRYDPDPAYVDASNLVSMWIIDKYQFDETRAFFPDYLGGYLKVLDELPAMHTFVYTEGTAASYVLARRAGSPPEVVDKLRRGALLAARFIIQQQIREGENDYFFPNPKKARGGVKYCMNHNKQRIDYTYHALSSVYRILHAATPEDYAFIQGIPLPKAW